MFIILAWSLGMLNWNTVNIYQILWDIMRVWFVIIYQIIQNVNHRGAGPPSAGETTSGWDPKQSQKNTNIRHMPPKVRQRIAKSLFASQNRHYRQFESNMVVTGFTISSNGIDHFDTSNRFHITTSRVGKERAGWSFQAQRKIEETKLGSQDQETNSQSSRYIKISRPAMIKGEGQKSSSHWIGTDDRFRMCWNVHKANRYLGLSENRVYSQWNSHLIGIMIINHWV